MGYTHRMSFVAMLILSPQPDPVAVLERMKAALSKPLTTEFSITRKDFPGKGTGRLTLEKPFRMKFSAKWGQSDFESASTEDRTFELTRLHRIYYESGPFDRLYQPQSSFSFLPDYAFPTILLVGDPRVMYPDSKPSYVGSELVNGASCDHVQSRGWDAWVAADGRLLKFRLDIPTQNGSVSGTFQFTNFKKIQPNPKSFYEPEPPAGFRPYGLPRDPQPLEVGMPFPSREWYSGSVPAAIEQGRSFLAVAVASDCEVSSRAARALATLRRDVPVWLFSDDGQVPESLRAFSVVKDRSNRSLNRLFVPGTPFFFLVGKDGRIKKLWYGFEAEREDEFIREVRAELGK